MKNTLDYFLEEYFFKPSAIVSYSAGGFGGVNAAQHLRLIFAEHGAPSISSSFAISRVKRRLLMKQENWFKNSTIRG
jgi:NAD(P)H-dependent FMN reductase